VTTRVNLMRGEGFAAENATKTHCPKGHAYKGGNLYQRLDGWRDCRMCQRETRNRYLARCRVRTAERAG
jgi:hypothetical protein